MLNKVKLKNYRNISDLEVEINPKSTIIIAPNSTGKTNFLESIYLNIYGSPFKSIENVKEIIGDSSSFAKANLEWDDCSTEVVVSFIDDSVKKSYFYNAKPTNLTKLASSHSAVVFAPDSVDIISGDPALRRQDLDNFLSSITREYNQAVLNYNKILKNRNALLKIIRDNRASQKELKFWTEKLIENAEIIFNNRVKFFKSMEPFVEKVVQEMNIFLKEEDYKYLKLVYVPNLDPKDLAYGEMLKSKFEENFDKEVIVGKTLYGVHKDDFSMFIKEKNVRFYGSRGQQRLATLLIKLAQIKYFKDLKNSQPLFLIDDLMSELDSSNRDNVSAYLLSSDIQFILTTAEELEIPKDLMDSSTIILL